MDSTLRQESQIRSAMAEMFHDAHVDIDMEVDEVVFSYIAGILEEPIDEVDMDEFISIMDAYVPGFATIEQDKTLRFMKRLKIQLDSQEATDEPSSSTQPQPVQAKPKRRNRRWSSRHSSESETNTPSHTATAANYSEALSGRSQRRTVSEASSVECEQSYTVGYPDHLGNNDSPGRLDQPGHLGNPDLPGHLDHADLTHRTLSTSSTGSPPSSLSESFTAQPGISEPTDVLAHKLETLTFAPNATAEIPDAHSNLEQAKSEEGDLVALLVEMFPDKTTIDIEKCLHNNVNNLEATVLCLLDEDAVGSVVTVSNHRRAGGTAGDSNVSVKLNSKASRQKRPSKSARKKSNSQSSDSQEVDFGLEKLSAAELKSQIVDKYSYIPTDAGEKTYTPKLQTSEEKKMVRYRNGQVVSTKGERFSDVKPALTDEMKKTYVNLKPAKQYRFH